MVVSLAGRRSDELASKFTHAWESVALILSDMASKVHCVTFLAFYRLLTNIQRLFVSLSF